MIINRFDADIMKSCIKDLVTPLLANEVDFQRESSAPRLKCRAYAQVQKHPMLERLELMQTMTTEESKRKKDSKHRRNRFF